MSAIFLLLWVVILVGLAGLTLQNLSVSISLVFLGLRSPSIPLGFLIVGAIAAGVLTGLVIIGLLNLSNRLTRGRFRHTPKAKRPQFRPPWQAWSSTKTTDNQTTDNQTDYTDSWDSKSDSWSWDEEDEPASQAGYEVEQQPKKTYQSGSTYSYSYRDDDQTGVGRPESVVEAEYRVITPPYRSDDIDDDYGFDEEDFEDENDENEDRNKPHNPQR